MPLPGALLDSPIARRAALARIARAALGVTAVDLLRPRACGAAAEAIPPGTNVVTLFMRGAMSHLDTFDPKPGKTTQGPTEAIPTRADGIRLGRYFPKLANQMDKAVLVRSMTSKQGAHPQAQYLMRTSYERRGTIQHPSLGA